MRLSSIPLLIALAVVCGVLGSVIEEHKIIVAPVYWALYGAFWGAVFVNILLYKK